MSRKLDEAIKELNEALSTIKEDCVLEAEESLFNNSKNLAKKLFMADYGWSLELGGIDWGVKDNDPPLTIYVHDHDGDGQLWKYDAIGWLIEGFTRDPVWISENGEPRLDDEDRARLHKAVSALQSGIDRIKAYEAKRDQAQS